MAGLPGSPESLSLDEPLDSKNDSTSNINDIYKVGGEYLAREVKKVYRNETLLYIVANKGLTLFLSHLHLPLRLLRSRLYRTE